MRTPIFNANIIPLPRGETDLTFHDFWTGLDPPLTGGFLTLRALSGKFLWEINAILGIEDKELVACIPIGYPDQAPLHRQGKKK